MSSSPPEDGLHKDKQQTSDNAEPRGGFLGRWSQRKRAAATREPLPDALPTDDLPVESRTDEQLPAGADPNEIEAPVLTDADMPDIETLNADSDFSPFFSDGVSKDLRNRALKKLFFSGKFSARDGLDDYDDDFTYFEPLGDTVTSDMKFHQRRKEKARLAELEALEESNEQAEEPIDQLEVTENAESDDSPQLDSAEQDDLITEDAELAQKPESSVDETPDNTSAKDPV